MAELADAPGSGSGGRKAVRVRLPPSAFLKEIRKMKRYYPDFLNKFLSEQDIKVLKERDALHAYDYKDITFVRLSQEYKRLWRGTVFYEDGILPGYPRIMRILHLENGLNRYFKDRFYIEEKVDGYNIRIAIINGHLVSFTRGGFVCPFSTDRLTDFINTNFFDTYPDYIICGEVVGPGSPYNTEVIPYIDEDVDFFAFDIIKKNEKCLPADDRYKILGDFEINQVNRWGPFIASDINKIKDIVLSLDRDGREGIVIKNLSGTKQAKYVTLSSCLRDLQATAHLIAELPAGFYTQRILRAVFFCHEFNISLSNEYLLNFSRALYLIPQNTLQDIANGQDVREYFDIMVKNRNTIDELIHHLNRSGVRTQLQSVEKAGDYYRARFYRVYIKGTKELRHRLMGKGFFD